jgi:hypothetical protein
LVGKSIFLLFFGVYDLEGLIGYLGMMCSLLLGTNLFPFNLYCMCFGKTYSELSDEDDEELEAS